MAVKFRDYYEVLGVPRGATEEEIRNEYRKLARKHHPDVNPGDKSAEDRFKEINEAYQVLSDKEKRRRYDQLGENYASGSDFTPPPGAGGGRYDFGDLNEAFRNGGGANGGFSDFFESLFGAGRANRASRAGTGFGMQGRDIEAEIGISLEEANRGAVRSFTVQVDQVCPECNGTGIKDGKTCPVCHGAGTVARSKSLETKIPAGVREGSVIRLAKQGNAGTRGATPGDLLLHVRLEPHPLFELIGEDDLQLDLPVAPWEAVVGAKVEVPSIEGKVEMTIRPGTQSGQRLRLRGQGLTRRSGGRGDLYAKINVVIPPQPTAREKELFEQLARESSFDARALMGRRS
jgi:DnaJ-class molecular chaperone